MVTHELKSPLVPIQGYADILLNGHFGKLTKSQKEKLEIIKLSADTLLLLISDLIDSQRLEAGDIKLDKQIHGISDIISEAVMRILPKAVKKGVDVITEVVDEMFCMCDDRRLHQVLFEILVNAIDFCPERNGKIKIILRRQDKNAEIIVVDNGIGIKKAKLNKIFVKFYQANTSTTREHSGIGIGLSVCKGLVEQHGGKIWAESKGIGKGAEIHTLIPVSD